MKDCKITPACTLVPLCLLAVVVALMLAFQMSQILRDRGALHQAQTQQEKPLEDAQKVQIQLNALATGTLKLAQSGDKDAKVIIDRMKQLGITVNGDKSAAAAKPAAAPTTPAPAPAEAP